jgi:Mg/Co/Ni transporter MgtE
VLTCVKEKCEYKPKIFLEFILIYVVDDEDRLKGRLSFKDLLTTPERHQ